jgi:hypothetical protein
MVSGMDGDSLPGTASEADISVISRNVSHILSDTHDIAARLARLEATVESYKAMASAYASLGLRRLGRRDNA